jgi:hypothetical protein
MIGFYRNAIEAARAHRRARRALVWECVALQHQLAVLRRSGTPRPRFRPIDQLFWVFLSWWWPAWRDALKVIQPETVLRWRNQGIALIWKYRNRNESTEIQRIPRAEFYMHEGVDQFATLYPLCFFRAHELCRPLKIGIREDIIAQHPELQPGVIESALQIYTRCVPYWSTLKVGTARIDLDGNVAGEVTLDDQQAAKLKIAKAERRAKAKEIEDRKKPAAPPVPSQPPGRRSR